MELKKVKNKKLPEKDKKQGETTLTDLDAVIDKKHRIARIMITRTK